MKSKRPKPQQLIIEDRLAPRAYQVELLSAAIERNTILCVSNDVGMQYVPLTLVKYLSPQVIGQLGAGARRTIYLCLDGGQGLEMMKERHGLLSMHLALNVGMILMETTSSDILSILQGCHVICMQASTFLACLEQNIISFHEINLLIFDECQEAIKENSRYAAIIQHLKDSTEFQKIRVFGLTSSMIGQLDEDPDQLQDKIRFLENRLAATAELTTDLNALDAPTVKPEEIVEIYSSQTGNDHELTAEIEFILLNAYHTLGDMVISQVDVVNAKKEKPKKLKVHDVPEQTGQVNAEVVEPELNSDDWLRLQNIKETPRSFLHEVKIALDELGLWCAGCVANNLCSTLDKLIEKTTEKLEKWLLQYVHTQLRLIYTLVDRATESIYDYEQLLGLSSPKLQKIISIIKTFLPKVDFEISSAISAHNRRSADLSEDGFSDFSDLSDGDSGQDLESVTVARLKDTNKKDNVVKVNQEETTFSGIIYAKRSYSAFAIHKYIEQLCIWDTDMYFIRSSYLIGANDSADAEERQMMLKKQEDRLTKFRQHKINLLVGTSTLESNIDIPKCNLVAMFDPPESYKSYIKTKRRARALNAKYYTICAEDQRERFHNCMNNYCKMDSILKSRYKLCGANKQKFEDCDLSVDGQANYPPPFVSPNTQATVTMGNAIGLLNRYCAKLPSDIFTWLTPTSVIKKVEDGFQAVIKLPVNCRIKSTVQGPVMRTEYQALAAAALSTCQLLYEQGELDENLMPIGKEYLKNPKQDLAWEQENQAKKMRGLPGSAKCKQYYSKKISKFFETPLLPNTECHLYRVTLTLKEDLSRLKSVPQGESHTIGLLLGNTIPQMAEFPVFTRSGEEAVDVSYCRSCTLTEEQLELVKRYHCFVFHNVLRLEKFPLKFEPQLSKFNLLVVPLETGGADDIAWDFFKETLQKYDQWKNIPSIFSRKRENFTFNEADFKDAVVMPSYRNQDQPEYFFVACTRHDLNPESPFPSPDLYENFYSYYTSKYGLAITNRTQPLLEVDRTSGRLNLLTPRFMNQKGVHLPVGQNKKSQKSTSRERQILIPELCDIHPCSASMWRKLVCIPSILSRMNGLLLSYELVQKINEGIGLSFSGSPTSGVREVLDLGIKKSSIEPLSIQKSKNSESTKDEQKAEVDLELLAEDLEDHDTPHLDKTYQGFEANESGSADENDSSTDVEDSSEDESYDQSCDLLCNLHLDREDHSSGQTGPPVTQILHALTMSNANDFINLERLETVGDSFLKFAVTLYLFCTHPGLHEGRLSYGRSKQVSNFNLYYLGKKIGIHEFLISEKFEPTENWLPPCYIISQDYQPIEEFFDSSSGAKNLANLTSACPGVIPYNLRTQHSIPDKAIADCVESLIGCYLTSCGPFASRLFMAWLGINVLPVSDIMDGTKIDKSYKLPEPPSPFFRYISDADAKLNYLLVGLRSFEERIGYVFNDKAYLVQAFTHASYVHNEVTDCYQRLEFLGDAVLDYVITRQLYEDQRKHSPGVLTDLRSALVNNNVFGALAVKWEFHKYIMYISTQMYESVHKFVLHQNSKKHKIHIDQYLRFNSDGDIDEEVEIPKVLGDIFESVAGAIYLDSNMSLDTLWSVYYPLMRRHFVKFSKHIPKSPVRELLELEPETAKFQRPERTKDGRIRVSVTIAGKDTWWGVGRSYRIAKCAAAKKALIALRSTEC